MRIDSCTFTIHFPQNNQIRESLFKLERHFSDFQAPFTLVPLPSDAPMDIPRIIAVSKHGHSQLMFCGNNAQLTTRFAENYSADVKKCVEYIRSKCEDIVSSLSIINGNSKFYFSGISMAIMLDKEDGICDPTAYISENFLKCKSSLPTDEAQFRLALTIQDKYYANIMVQNSRLFSNGPNERGSYADSEVVKDTLQVILDINDRYAFNKIRDYVSTQQEVNYIASLIEKFATEHVTSFIETGVISYDE